MAIIGLLSLGKTDELDGECIETTFVVVGLPLVPVSSHYCTWASGFRWKGFAVRMRWKSVIFTYLRWWTVLVPICALLVALVGGMDKTNTLTERALCLGIPILVIAAWVMVCFFVPRPGALARKQRLVLGHVTGVAAWPEIQTRESLLRFAEHLDRQWWSRSLPPWRLADPARIEGDALLVLYARLRYGHVLEPMAGWMAARDAVWQRIERDWSLIEPVLGAARRARVAESMS